MNPYYIADYESMNHVFLTPKRCVYTVISLGKGKKKKQITENINSEREEET